MKIVAVNYFREKNPSNMVDRVLNMPLSLGNFSSKFWANQYKTYQRPKSLVSYNTKNVFVTLLESELIFIGIVS